jgi:hypothetical protein
MTTSTSNKMKRSASLGLFTSFMMMYLALLICSTTPVVRAFTASSPLSTRYSTSSYRSSSSSSSSSSSTSIKAIADPVSATAFMIAATGGIPEDSMPAVVAIVALGVGFYAYSNNNDNEESSSGGAGGAGASASTSSVGGKKKTAGGKNDISIPYDSAAYLSYETFLKEHNKKASIGRGFDAYNKLYKKRAIAEVTVKALQNKVDTTTKEIMKLVE